MSVNLTKGQRVRVTFEGYLDCQDHDGELHFKDEPHDDLGNYYAAAYENMPGFKVEVIEPDLIDGEIYRDADGDVFMYCGARDQFREIGYSDWWSSDYPARPLIRLVPENIGA